MTRSFDHDRRHGRGLAIGDVGDLGLPQLPAGRRVHRNRVSVEQVVDDLAVGVERAPIDRVAAGDADRFGLTSGRYFHLSG